MLFLEFSKLKNFQNNEECLRNKRTKRLTGKGTKHLGTVLWMDFSAMSANVVVARLHLLHYERELPFINTLSRVLDVGCSSKSCKEQNVEKLTKTS